jgi:hypothetical protein
MILGGFGCVVYVLGRGGFRIVCLVVVAAVLAMVLARSVEGRLVLGGLVLGGLVLEGLATGCLLVLLVMAMSWISCCISCGVEGKR